MSSDEPASGLTEPKWTLAFLFRLAAVRVVS
jgi:hypothetical protein